MYSSLASILQLLTSHSCSVAQAPIREPESSIASHNPPPLSQFSLPIQNVYQSARTLPALPSNPPSTSQPFLGFSAVAAPSGSLSTQNANQARLASAAATIPRQQQVPRRGSRRRGPARPPPALAHQPIRAKIENCLLETDPDTIRVQVRVYPPTVSYLSAL